MLKPHLTYWGTKFRWRGDIYFQTEDQCDQFFATYKEWKVMIATLAEEYNAEILCIGTEYCHSLSHDAAWREVIKAVREVYDGKLTYGANWDTYENVTFWDALDYIGIQAYFPLIDSDYPSEADLKNAWYGIYEKIIPFARKYNKKIVFTEIGYNSSPDAARIPWGAKISRNPIAFEMQRRCLEVALRLNTNHEYIAGIFIWKWFPAMKSFDHHENFNLQRPAIKRLISDVWHN